MKTVEWQGAVGRRSPVPPGRMAVIKRFAGELEIARDSRKILGFSLQRDGERALAPQPVRALRACALFGRRS